MDVIHAIQQDCGAIFWIHNNKVYKDMPILIEQVMLVNMPPPSCETMVPLPHVEYFARMVRNVRVILEHGVKFRIGLLPQWTPRGVDIIGDKENLIEVVVGGDI